MSTYKIDWTLESWYSVEIDAENSEKALEVFWETLGSPDVVPRLDGQEVQDSIVISKVR